MATTMLSFEDADNLVKAFFRAHEQGVQRVGEEPPALNSKGFGAAQLGEGQIYFEYHPDRRALECSALVYRFRAPPRQGVLEGFRAEARAGTDTGGGELDFEPENGGLYLSRFYGDRVPHETFVTELNTLLGASVTWAKDVLPRVAGKVFPKQ